MENKEYPYLYLGSVSEARRYGELDKWRESHRENIACKEAIEMAIRKGFDGMYLDDHCARDIIEAYGYKRVCWVLANTLQQKKEDGRFSLNNKAWAASTFIPQSDRSFDFVVESHSAVLDGFVDQFRRAQAELRLFDRTHCDTMTGQELKGRVLVLDPWTLKESCWTAQNQLWLATGGFGCRPAASGRAVFAICLGDGEHTRWDRGDFTGILREEHLPGWAKERLAQIQSSQASGAVTSNHEQVMKL